MTVRKYHVNQVSFKSKFEALLILPLFVCLANTKGNKRSRTRTDSYSAGQSVGGYIHGRLEVLSPFVQCFWNRVSFVIAIRKHDLQ